MGGIEEEKNKGYKTKEQAWLWCLALFPPVKKTTTLIFSQSNT